jgi:hypothetical protein
MCCCLLRHELFERSRLISLPRRSSEDTSAPQEVHRRTEEVMQRLGLLVEARRMVYVSVLRPSMPQLHHVCVALLADQVMQLSLLCALAQSPS